MNCSLCNNVINGKYYADYWNNKVCAYHIEEGYATHCSSCGAITAKEYQLEDGRVLCKICNRNSVTHLSQIRGLIRRVKKSLVDVGFDNFQIDDINISLLTAEELAIKRNTNRPDTNNKGLTLSNVSNSIGGLLLGNKQKCTHNIFILYRLTKVEFAGVLAHEFLHAWQIKNSISLEAPKCEGLCNMGSFLLFSTLSSSLSSHYIKNLFDNPDPVYGGGFRYVHALYEEVGWEGVINKALKNNL